MTDAPNRCPRLIMRRPPCSLAPPAEAMSGPRYLFVLSKLHPLFTARDEPTPEDLAHAESGTPLIVRLADFHYNSREDECRPITVSVLGTVEIDHELTLPFHAPVEYFENYVDTR